MPINHLNPSYLSIHAVIQTNAFLCSMSHSLICLRRMHPCLFYPILPENTYTHQYLSQMLFPFPVARAFARSISYTHSRFPRYYFPSRLTPLLYHSRARPPPPSKLGTAFLPTFLPGASILGTPWIVRGSRIRLTSNCAGILDTTVL